MKFIIPSSLLIVSDVTTAVLCIICGDIILELSALQLFKMLRLVVYNLFEKKVTNLEELVLDFKILKENLLLANPLLKFLKKKFFEYEKFIDF